MRHVSVFVSQTEIVTKQSTNCSLGGVCEGLSIFGVLSCRFVMF